MSLYFPKADFFIKNRERLAALLPPGSLAILNSSDEFPRNGDQAFPFRQNSDLFYLSGIEQEMTKLMLFPDHPNATYKTVLFIRKPDPSLETWEGKKIKKEEATSISGIKTIMFLDEFEAVLTEAMSLAENIFLNANEYPKYSNPVPYSDLRFAISLKERYPLHNYERLAPELHKLRTIKSEEEIKLIRHAIDVTGKAFLRVLKNVEPGMKETDVEAEITHEFMINGVRNHAYKPIIASGVNACFLHYTSNNGVCSDGELLLMDFGAEYLNYAADITRTIPVNGRFTGRQKKVYNAVLNVQKNAIALFVPGKSIDLINKEVNLIMEQELMSLGLFSGEDVKKQASDTPLYTKYFMHGVSHFIGLDVHDVGSKYEDLKPGMVLTCEPGIYLREEKMGIRTENIILVTEKEPVDLSSGIPREVEVIETLMKKN